MITLPPEMMIILTHFAPEFSERVWEWAQVLVAGAILAPGKRTVTSALRVMGLSEEQQFQNYHRVLNRAKWSALNISRILLGLIVRVLVGIGVPLVVGADETLERRKGDQIKAKGVFRDAARSSRKHVVYSFGLRWISMMALVSVPWSTRVWALPFLTVLAPSERTNQANGKRHKTSIDWTMQMITAVRRWVPDRIVVLVTDGGLAAVKLGLRCARFGNPVTYISRLRLDARLFDEPGPQPPSKPGPKPKKGRRQRSLKHRLRDPKTKWWKLSIPWYGGKKREIEVATGTSLWYTSGFAPLPIRWLLVRDPLGEFETTAFFSTDQTLAPRQILIYSIMRWGLEVTFEEARAHLGMETQRQWSDLAIARTTPALLGLFSLITLLAHRLTRDQPLPIRTAAWYQKQKATFSDVIALVRRYLWMEIEFANSPATQRLVQFPAPVLAGLVDTVCYST
jgi:hypothetical protein